MGNMYCSSQKANSREWDDNFCRIFNKVEEVREVHTCKMCEKEGGVVCSKAEWEELWGEICDKCAFILSRKEEPCE